MNRAADQRTSSGQDVVDLRPATEPFGLGERLELDPSFPGFIRMVCVTALAGALAWYALFRLVS